VRIPIKATAREPNKQAGYISATSDIQQIPYCETQPVHTFGSKAEAKQCSRHVRCASNSGYAFSKSGRRQPNVGSATMSGHLDV
jgi:hypothetical protein